jgi:ABC-type dipeptide/oligopeptide/nickel transport system permease component
MFLLPFNSRTRFMGFFHFLIKRLLYVIPTIFLVTVLVFSILHLVPGDPVDALLSIDQNTEMRNMLIKQLGFDQPLYVQYYRWMSRVVRGDLGQSILHARPVATLVKESLPRTAYLAVAAMLFALAVSLPLGILAAVRRKTWVDYSAQISAMIGMSVPAFWLALLVMFYFGLKLRWFPTVGYVAPGENFPAFLYHLCLPAVTLGIEMVAVMTRMTRSSMLEELNKDYVQTHRSQGLPDREIIARYTLKNAMLPTLTIASIRMAGLLGGTVVIETVFAWPGIGLMILEGIQTRDYPVVQGGVLVLAFSFIFINLIVDILYKWLDPRIKLE